MIKQIRVEMCKLHKKPIIGDIVRICDNTIVQPGCAVCEQLLLEANAKITSPATITKNWFKLQGFQYTSDIPVIRMITARFLDGVDNLDEFTKFLQTYKGNEK